MKKFLLLLSFISPFGGWGAFSQNLVPNPSFENFTTCPVGFSQYNGYISDWVDPSAASPDYMNACANPFPAGVPANGTGWQQTHSGDAYSGGYTGTGTLYREYIQVQLISPLIAGVTYQFEMYVVLHNRSQYATDDLGAYFSVTSPTSAGTGLLSGNPVPQITNTFGNVITDTLNWTLISGSIVAAGGEQFVTLGHFLPDTLSTYLQVNFGSQGAYYYYDDVSLTGNAVLPVANFTASATTICAENCIDFTNLSLNATSYEWTFAGAVPANDTNANPTNICYSSPGTYTVTLIATNSVTSDTTTITSYITVNPIPAAPTITQSVDTLSVMQGYASYQWFFGSDTIAGATDYFYVATQNGNYNLIVTDTNGCSVGAGILNVFVEPDRINKFNVQGLDFYVYPNPAKDNIIFTMVNPPKDGFAWANGLSSIVSLEMYNSLGEKVYAVTRLRREVEAQHSVIINTSYFSTGIYLLKITFENPLSRTEENIYTHKIIIQQ